MNTSFMSLRFKNFGGSLLFSFLIVLTIGVINSTYGQGLEEIIVEEYYVSDANDEANNAFGAPVIGSTTYRVYVDMAPGYKLQSVTGFQTNELLFSTTTSFFNSAVGGELGENIVPFTFLLGNTPLDSYISLGSGRSGLLGVLKTDDPDGSIIVDNTNTPPDGIPITTSDGLIAGSSTSTSTLGLTNELPVFGVVGGSEFQTTNGSYFNLNGVEGPDANNRVLIGQFTTDGDFSFKINVQIFDENSVTEAYTHTEVIDFDGNESVLFPGLIFPIPDVEGCTNDLACNYNPLANIDDGSCLIPQADCTECNDSNDGLDLIDDDGDGVCNAEEMPGCSSPTACNYDPTVDMDNDDGSCLEPVPNCSECQGEDLILIDDDGDGICNADEIPGCTSSTACNFDPSATDDDDSCLEPIENCLICNDTNDALILVDSDGDGICDADEIPGCTNSLACNFDPNATDDDGSCTDEPIDNCTECDGENLIIIDTDGDGICDADEIPGCTNVLACNYNINATDDDGSCIVPVENCTECNGTNDGLDLIDDDNDGTCNADDECPDLPDLVNGDPCITEGGLDGTVAECECVTDIVLGCISSTACNFNPDANLDDGSCIEPIENCQICNETNDGLIIVDTDGDGICDADEVPGCTNQLSCNYNSEATDDDGTCTDEPIENCTECNGEELVLIDDDGDGICNADEIAGCTNDLSCNYNPEATDDDGTCTDEPIENCTECNGEELILIDDDGDGICNADEILGCTNELSCNYNPEATDDDGTCTDEPVENCSECQGDMLVIIDSDGDGICDADEIPGCTDPTAENYNPDATDDDGSCIFIASITLLELDCGEKIIQVTNAQSTETDGGQAIADTRTVYAYGPDNQDEIPTYMGDIWPYVIVPAGFTVDDPEISAEITTNDDNVLLIDGRPLYQYTGDTDETSTEGTFGPWSYFLPNGWINQDACGTVSTTNVFTNSEIKVFPNPTRKDLHIKFDQDLKINEKINVKVFNATGNLVKELNFETSSSRGEIVIDTETLSNGVYLLNITSENGVNSLRFVKN